MLNGSPQRGRWLRALTPCAIATLLGIGCFWMMAVDADYFLDRPFDYLTRDIYSPNYLLGTVRSLRHFETVLACAAFVCLLPAILFTALGLARAVSVDPLVALAERLAQRRNSLVAALMATATAGAGFVALALVKGAQTIDDEHSYLMQARLFAKGVVKLPAPPAALANPMVLTQSVWTSKYPPGNALFLMIGTLLGDERIVPAILASALVYFVYVFSKNAFGANHGLLAASLVALSPVVWAQYGSLMAFGTSACACAAMLAALSSSAVTGRARFAFLSGVALGVVAITRPHEALGLGAPVLVMLAAQAARNHPGARRRFVAFGVGGASVVWVLLAHNYVVAGSPLHYAYQLDPDRFNVGFRQTFAQRPYVHTLHAAVGNAVTVLARLDLWMLAWPASMLLVLAGLLRTRRSPFDALLAAMLGSFALFMTVIFAPGTWDFGPTYYFVCIPIFIPLAVRGLSWIRDEAARANLPIAARALGWLPVLGVITCWLTIAPIRFCSIYELSREVRAPWELLAQRISGDALVALPAPFRNAPGWAFGYPYSIPTGPGTFARLFRARSPQEHVDAVRFLGAGLPVYGLEIDDELFWATGKRKYFVVPIAPGDDGLRAASVAGPVLP